MLISHFCFSLDTSKGGVPAGVLTITEQLTQYGIKNQIISTGNTLSQIEANSKIIARLELEGIGFLHSVSRFENNYGIGAFRDLKKNLDGMPKPNLVVLHQIYSFSTIMGYFYARKLKIPYVVHPHGSLTKYHEYDSRIKKAFAKKLIISKILRDSNAVIVTCASEKNDLAASLQSKAINLPYGAIKQSQKIENTLPELIPQGDERIIFCGRFDKKKNLPLLIESLPKVLKIYPRLTLDIAGSGTSREVKQLSQLITSLNLESNVVLHGWIGAEKIKQLLCASKLLVLPSENENFALVVSEALSLGVPCVVSKQVGTSEIVAKHRAGEVIDQLTSSSIANGILKVLQGDGAAYRSAAFEATREDLDWSKIAMQWKALVDSLA